MPYEPTHIEHLAARIAELKAEEQQANAMRIEAEKQLLAKLGELDAEGTSKFEAGQYQITVRCSVTRAVDREALERIAAQIPEAIAKRLFRWKPELDTRELRYVQNNEVELYGVLAQAITTKAAKPSISIERREG
jgi:hypothetical protein